MNKYFLSFAIVLACLVAPSVSVPGKCGAIKTTIIPDLNTIVGFWWRPFRSQMAPEEPRFKCLSTLWNNLNLERKTFDVVDYNQDLVSGVKTELTGTIKATDVDNAKWDIELSNGMKVKADILDVDEEYMLMYSCLETGDTHEERGIIFTRQRLPGVNKLNEFIRRAEETFKQNDINHVFMLSIPLNDC